MLKPGIWLLSLLCIHEEPYKIREMFREDNMAGTHEVVYIAEKLIEQFLPQIRQDFAR
jgi:hypothetical protein